MIKPVIDAAVTHSRTVISILVLLLVSGIYAYVSIPKESSPDVDIPQIYVSTSIEGISPDDAERMLLRPLEQELATVEGIDEMKSTAYQGGGFVLLEFQAGFDKDAAIEDVQKAVDQVRPELPASLDSEPRVTEVNFSLFPVLVVMLHGNIPERTLVSLARDLEDRIEAIPSVLEVNIGGDREELVEVLINPELIESYDLRGEDIMGFFQRSNRLVAAGNIDTGSGRFAIEVPGLFENAEDIMNMPIRVSGDSAIKVKDIAEIRRTYKDPESFARLDGERAIALEVVKRSGENIIDTIGAVRKEVEEERQFWPEAVKVTYTQDESETIKTMLKDLENNMISAVLLVMIVIVSALGLRASGLVGIAIPGAFLSGILVLYVMDLTVNLVVLFSLILSVGMLVDGAIVVVEYADRKMAEGLHRRQAFAAAAKRMSWPIISATATTLAAFFPLLFWPDLVGEFMKYLPLTLIVVLSSSLLMALIFVPTLGSLVGKPGAVSSPETMKMLAAAEQGDISQIKGFTGKYVSVLDKALSMPGRILLLALVLLVAVQFSYYKFGKGVEFFPDVEPEVASILVHARGNLSIHEQDQLVREVESRVLDVEGIETVYTRTGKADPGRSDIAEDVIGQVRIQFLDWDQRRSASEILAEIREKTGNIAGIMVEPREQEEGPPTGKDVQVQLASRNPEKLDEAVEFVIKGLNELGGFRDIEDSRPLPGIEWSLKVDRAQAAKFGVDVTLLGYYIRMVTNGLVIAKYRPDDSDDEIDIALRHDVGERTLDALDRVRITTPYGSVPIGNFVERVPEPAQGVINRSDQKRIMTVKADVMPDANVAARVEEIRDWIENNRSSIDKSVEVTFRGQDEEQRESSQFLTRAFIVAIFIMAIILVTQFNSFYSALLILSAVIMSTIGVMIGLLITGQPFGIIMSGVGVIALAGIIVNNNIVLIDTFDYLRDNFDYTIRETILRTGAQRLRPVLLTTITTVVGLMPMVLQVNIDFLAREISYGAPSTQWWVQLATAVVFGLTFSTVLTLIVTPAALMFRENAAKAIKQTFGLIKQKFSTIVSHRNTDKV